MSKQPFSDLKVTQKDHTGNRFGKLTVLGYLGGGLWLVGCACGNEIVRKTAYVSAGAAKSCGCNRNPKKHGHTRRGWVSPEYRAWVELRARCNPDRVEKSKAYIRRGITVCPRWLESFENFLEDMGIKPSPKHSLDRINNDGNYEPGNCRWATAKEQGNNRSNNRRLSLAGVSKTVSEWSRELGIPWHVIRNGQRAGLTDAEILCNKDKDDTRRS